MKNKPLVVFTGLAAVTAVALGAIIYSRMPGPGNKPTEVAVSQPATPEKQPDATVAKPPETAPAQPETKAEQLAPEPAPAPATPTPEQPKTEAQAPAKPTFDTVRVEPEGSTLAAGHATPGAEVTLKRNGEEVGKALANEDGDWVVVTEEPLPKGASELSLEQKAPAGPATVSDQSIAIVVPDKPGERAMVALVEPGMPTQVLQKAETAPAAEIAPAKPEEPASGDAKTTAAAEPPPATVAEPETKAEVQAGEGAAKPSEPATAESATPQPTTSDATTEPTTAAKPAETQTALTDSTGEVEQPTPAPEPSPAPAPEIKAGMPVSLDAVDYNSAGDIVFSGSASPGAAVRVYVDNKPVGDSVADAAGKWSFAGTEKVAPGGHSLRIDQIDEGGKVMSRVELPFVREDAARVAEILAPEQEAGKTAPAVEPVPAAPAVEVTPEQPAIAEVTKTEDSETAAATADQAVTQPEAAPQPSTPSTEIAKTEEPPVAQQPPAAVEKPASVTEEPAATAAKSNETTTESAATTAAEGSSTVTANTEAQSETAAKSETDSEPVHVETQSSEAAKTAETAVAPQPKNGRVVIQPGNNLWKLSRVIYGKGISYTVIYEANKQQIRDPDLIYPGQIFATPNAVPPESIDPKRHKPLTPGEGGAVAE